MTALIRESFGWLPVDSAGAGATDAKLASRGYYNFNNPVYLSYPAKVADNGAFGDRCLRETVGQVNASPLQARIRPAGDTVAMGYAGARMLIETDQTNGGKTFLTFFDMAAGIALVSVSCEAFGVIKVYRGDPKTGTLLAATAGGAYVQGAEFYLEASCAISDSAGEVEVRVNTVTVIHLMSADTKPATATGDYFDGFGWGGYGSAPTEEAHFRIQDVYLNDDQGSVNNSFLGNVRCRWMPLTGAGASTDFSKTGAATNWQAASNTAIDDTAYVSSATAGDEDLYTVSPILGSQVVHDVTVLAFLRMDDATQRVSRNLFRIGSTTAEGDDTYINQTYTGYSATFETNPDTGLGLTGTDVNGAQVGIKVES